MVNNVQNNISSIFIYSMSLATAIGFNALLISIFDSFKWENKILANFIYFFTMLALTISLGYYVNSKVI
jgi:hypothetical protein